MKIEKSINFTAHFSSESELRVRPYVANYESGVNAAILSLCYGWIDGVNDLFNTPRIAYERHGPFNGLAGTCLAVTNSVLKAFVGTLSAVTWLCRGLYANVNNPTLDDAEDGAAVVSTLALEDSEDQAHENESHSKMIEDVLFRYNRKVVMIFILSTNSVSVV